MSKRVEAVSLPTNDAKVVVKFIRKHIFTRFGTPRAIISDGGNHFINNSVHSLLAKYGVRHKVATTYHPQTSGQVETIYKTSIETFPYRMVFGKARHLPAELEHKAYWAIKKLNLDVKFAGRKRITQLHELEKFSLHAYENDKLYKEKTKRKLRSKWSGPFEVVRMTQHGVVELRNKDKSSTFLVNGQRVKHSFRKDLDWKLEEFTLNEE
ncbi:uncharacterized protein LOC125831072 [Solanum verrucosum]|uniref:uncharacterized protein LOC125831072 n=1 Tax=Solanum verrucosum TaxID=315347 RepID=UPI0020D07A63|nr:uncharacterized protein LOC125831072 [Solanum verrucosum]